jgi:hypothetical protein
MQQPHARRAALTDISNAEDRPAKKQMLNYYTDTCGLEETAEKMRGKRIKAQNAVAARIAKTGLKADRVVVVKSRADVVIYSLPHEHKPLEKGMAVTRRKALEFYFVHILGAPVEDMWLRDGVVLTLVQALRISPGSTAEVKQVCRDVLAVRARGVNYDESAGARQRGRKPLILELTPQAEVAYEALGQGLSTYQTAVLLNEWRAVQYPVLPPLSWSAVQGFVQRSGVIDRSRRQYKKSGKDDLNSPWAKARVQQCTQFKKQIELGLLPATSEEVVQSIADGLPPIHVNAIAWWDENHKKVVLGHTAKFENRVARNRFDGTPTPVQFGGVLPPKSMRTAVKFAGEARGCFGCAVVEGADGITRGVKAVPYEYTGKFVIGMKEWVASRDAEMRCVMPLEGV